MIIGMTIMAMGLATLVGQGGLLTWQLYRIFVDPLGPVAAIGVGSMHALQALAFTPGTVSAVEHRLLVLFSALLMTLIGLALLRRKNSTHLDAAPTLARKGGSR